jgi:hypothetical protein
MIYDVRQEYPAVAACYSNFHKTEQAVRDQQQTRRVLKIERLPRA